MHIVRCRTAREKCRNTHEKCRTAHEKSRSEEINIENYVMYVRRKNGKKALLYFK